MEKLRQQWLTGIGLMIVAFSVSALAGLVPLGIQFGNFGKDLPPGSTTWINGIWTALVFLFGPLLTRFMVWKIVAAEMGISDSESPDRDSN